MSPISEKTSVTIGVIFALVGGIVYVTNVAFEARANSASIKDIQQKQNLIEEVRTTLEVVKVKLEVVATKIELIEKKIDLRRNTE